MGYVANKFVSHASLNYSGIVFISDEITHFLSYSPLQFVRLASSGNGAML